MYTQYPFVDLTLEFICYCPLQGYALIEYEEHSQAKAAIEAMNGKAILEQTVNCDFAFVKPTGNDDRGRRGFSSRNNRGGYGGRRSGRSRSPGRR
jgi:RNA-binding protein 8A